MRLCAIIGLFVVGCTSRPALELPATATSLRTEELQRPGAQHAPMASASVHQVLREIASVRGWPVDSLPPVEFVSNANILDALRADAQLQVPAATQFRQDRVFQMLGWVPDDFNLERDILAPLSQELTGYYSFALRQIWLARHMSKSDFDATLRHELVHAVQDFRYHLANRLAWSPNNSDYAAALHSLAEGEAYCIERQIQDRSGRGCLDDDEFESLRSDAIVAEARIPAVMARSLAAPYVDGRDFVRRRLREGGWLAVERAWAGELTQTRQLYRNVKGSRAEPIPAPPLSPTADFSPCREDYADSLGAQGLRSALGDSAPVQATTKFVSDGIHSWSCEGGSTLLIWQLRLETPEAATSILDALRQSLGWGAPDSLHQGCATTGQIVGGTARNGHDIAIVLLRSPHGQLSHVSSQNCSRVNTIAGRATDFQ